MPLPLNHSAEYMRLIAAQLEAHARQCSAPLLTPCRPLGEALAAWGAGARGAERMAMAARIWWHSQP